MQVLTGRNMVVDSCSTNPLDRHFMVNNAAVRNDKPVQEALAEIWHSDASWFCGDIASRSFCVVRSSLVRLALRERMSTICASEQNA
jgi:hypothetical protein